MLHGCTLFWVDGLRKRLYMFSLRVSFPLGCPLTALWQLRFLTVFAPANLFPAAAVTTVLPITKLTTVTVYLLHLICSQNVSPVEPMLMDMTGGGWLVTQSGKGLAKCQFCKSATCKWDGTVAALLVLVTMNRYTTSSGLTDITTVLHAGLSLSLFLFFFPLFFFNNNQILALHLFSQLWSIHNKRIVMR